MSSQHGEKFENKRLTWWGSELVDGKKVGSVVVLYTDANSGTRETD